MGSTQENFIIIYNSMITEEDNYHLTIEELYLYALLRKKQNFEGYTETSIAFLAMTSPVAFASTKHSSQRNYKTIKDLLFSLKVKGIILIKREDEQKEDYKPNDYLKVDYASSTSGYSKIPYSAFDKCKTMTDFYIYCAVARWDNQIFSSSYGRWAKILQLTDRRVVEKIKEAIDRKVIHKNIGDYTKSENSNQKMQRNNQYGIKPFSKDQKSNMTIAKESAEANEEFHGTRKQSKDEVQNMIEATKVFSTYEDSKGRNIYPHVNDYVYYFRTIENIGDNEPTTVESNFLMIANRRMEAMKKNQKFKKDFQKAKDIFSGNYVAPKVQDISEMF